MFGGLLTNDSARTIDMNREAPNIEKTSESNVADSTGDVVNPTSAIAADSEAAAVVTIGGPVTAAAGAKTPPSSSSSVRAMSETHSRKKRKKSRPAAVVDTSARSAAVAALDPNFQREGNEVIVRANAPRPDPPSEHSLNAAQMIRMQLAMPPPAPLIGSTLARVQLLQQQNQLLMQQAHSDARQQLYRQLLLQQQLADPVAQYLQQQTARAAAASSLQLQLQQQRGAYSSMLVPSNRPEWMSIRDSTVDAAYRIQSFPLPPPTERNPFAITAFPDAGPRALGPSILSAAGTAGLSSAALQHYGIVESNIPLSLPVCLSRDEDSFKLSTFQVLLRKQIEAFQATEDDVTTHTRGRNKPISFGQVGIRCLHCAHLPVATRKKGSTYFPAAVLGIYQAAQNMCSTHIQCGLCSKMPDELKSEFARLLTSKVASSGAGRPYWAESAKQLGLVDTQEGGIRFIRSLRPGDRVVFNNEGKVDDDNK